MQKRSLYSILCLLFLAAAAQAGKSCESGTCSYTKTTRTTSDCGSCGYGTSGVSQTSDSGYSDSSPSDSSNNTDDSSTGDSPSDAGTPGGNDSTGGAGSNGGGSSQSSNAGSSSQSGRYANRDTSEGSSRGRYANRGSSSSDASLSRGVIATNTLLTGAIVGSTIYDVTTQNNRYYNTYARRRYGRNERNYDRNLDSRHYADTGSVTATSVRTGSNRIETGYANEINGRRYCGPVTVEAPGYELAVNFRALFVKPTTSNLDYAVVSCLPSGSSSSYSYNTNEINTKYRFGFDLGFAVMLPYCSNFGLNYEHFKTSHTSFAQGSTDGLCTVSPVYEACACVTGPVSGAVIAADSVPLARGTVAFKFDSVHALFGQYVQVSELLQAHFFAGVNYSSIKQRITTAFSTAATVATDNRIISTPMRFSGAGPEFGVDFNYLAIWGMKLGGRLSTAILLGHSTNYSTISSISATDLDLCALAPNFQALGYVKRTQNVPLFQGRIGAGFDFTAFNYLASFEAGFESRMYFNALQAQQITSVAPQAGLAPLASEITVGSLAKNSSNFGLSGAYVSFCAGF